MEEGWSAATPDAIRRVDEASGGAANVLLIRNAPVKLDHPTYSTHDELVTACETATRLGWLTIISADGTWAARRPADHPDGDRYGRRLSDFRNRAAPAAVVSDVEALARRAFEAECHAVWEISNESFLAGRGVSESQVQAFDERRLDVSQLPRIAVRSQPELRQYENSIGAAIKRGFPGAVLGSNSGAGADFVEWISAHGNPDERLAPDCEPGWDCALTETDNRVYPQETWLRWIETFRERGALLVIWRGPNTVESMTGVFRSMAERYPPRRRGR